ncbi:hypothetical protein HPT27_01100 [Permianibacter sp. IMCC34836]|uniref:sugar-transfer associated ATP-grasp domain-containing protein n=1 Tax=Permianibacter fluminis TaxID=2738515 RepID=UPI00155360F9|nr:sugar-transfer associated ATP-grasp domain-containing protein [Permianibacter fluminis]NQD35598.1 hypothetical protein [Permianibacter fluminis]
MFNDSKPPRFMQPMNFATLVALARWHAARDGIPAWRQILEAITLRLLRGHSIQYYYFARCYRRSLRWQEKWHHFSIPEYDRLCDRLNPHRATFRFKTIQKCLFLQTGIPTPHLIGYLHTNEGWSSTGQRLCDANDLSTVLAGYVGSDIIIKDAHGSGGEDCHAFTVVGNGAEILLRSGRQANLQPTSSIFSLLASHKHGYLIESRFEQHPQLAALNESSVNTIRVLVARAARDIKVVGAFLRVGSPGALVDNTAAGGLIVKLDEQRGVPLEITTGDLCRRQYSQFPGTELRCADVQLPFWQETLQLAVETLRRLPETGIAGLDIAIGIDGPAVLEINTNSPSILGFASFDKPGRMIFKTLDLPLN